MFEVITSFFKTNGPCVECKYHTISDNDTGVGITNICNHPKIVDKVTGRGVRCVYQRRDHDVAICKEREGYISKRKFNLDIAQW